ncbi:MAG: ferrous iron transport protein B [Magnetococcales bacterium]|nr:ferrous iron transport protein B [Magnetococcales bacterium]
MTDQAQPLRVAFVGNPNSGKTALLNKLVAKKAPVGNYPRVTVSVREEKIELDGQPVILHDLPGLYSLNSRTPEEKVARDYLINEHSDVIVNVIDAGNLERSFFLSTQLIELGRPVVYVLNMIDEIERRGAKIDTSTLSQLLGGPIVKTAGRKGTGLDELKKTIIKSAKENQKTTRSFINFDMHVENAVQRVQDLIGELHPANQDVETNRWMAIKLLEGDDEILRQEGEHDHLIEMVRREGVDLANEHGQSCNTVFADARYGFVNSLLEESLPKNDLGSHRQKITHTLDEVFLNRYFGLPIFIGLLWLMFQATFSLGEVPMDWIDTGVGAFGEAVSASLPEGMVHDLVVDGIIAGVGGTIIFLPNIVILFFFMALFSETGYLARAAFLMDRIMHIFGLHGKALIPMVMGFGCNVPAVMAARTIESDRARMITILVNPFMLCAARLPVFILFSGAFFAESAGTVVFAMYMLSIMGAMLGAVILSKFVFRGENEAFVMELPPYRLPTARSIVAHMWDKGMNFLKKIAGIILVGSIVLWFAQEFPQNSVALDKIDQEITTLQQQPESKSRNEAISALELKRGEEHLSGSFLGQISQTVAPVFAPLDFNWKDTVAILTGLVAKEVVVASYAVIYSQGEDESEESASLRTVLASTMTPLVAMAFMVFALFYAPCLATIATIKSETGSWKWAGFSVVFSTMIAYTLAFSVVTIGGMFV